MKAVRVLVIQHEDDTGPGWIGERLRALGAELDVVHTFGSAARPQLRAGSFWAGPQAPSPDTT